MAKNVFLEFESDIEALEGKIAELRELEESTADHEQRVSVDKEIQQLQKKATQLVKKVYADLTPWQISQVARHPIVLIPWTILSRFLPISMNSTGTVPLQTTRRS